MNDKEKTHIALSIFLLAFILLFFVGIIGTIMSFRGIPKYDKSKNELFEAEIEEVGRRYRASENNIIIRLKDKNEIIKIQVAKVVAINIEAEESVHIFKNNLNNNYVILEYLDKIRLTYWLRIGIFVLCFLLSFLFLVGFISILRHTVL